MTKRVDLIHGSILKAMLQLMVPILICGLFQQLYNMADGIVVGKFVGDTGVAIIGGSSSSLINLFTGTCSSLIGGCMVVLAYYFGAQNYDDIFSAIMTSLLVVLGTCTVIVVVFFVGMTPILHLLKVPADIFRDTASFMRFYALGFIPYGIFQVCVNMLRSFGETRVPTLLLIGSFVLNVVFDFIFVGLMPFEQYGICVAYITAQCISAALGLWWVRKITHIRYTRDKASKESLNRIVEIAVPAICGNLFFSFSTIYCQTAINMLGSHTITCYAIYNKLERMLWVLMEGISVAVMTMFGQNFGAKEPQRIRRIVYTGVILSVVISAAVAVVLTLGQSVLIPLFTKDAATYAVTSSMIWVIAKYFVAYAPLETLQAYLKCSGHSKLSVAVLFIGVAIFRIGYVRFYVMNGHLDYQSVLMCFAYSWMINLVLYALSYLAVSKKDLAKLENV